jgi:hypothetical protein
MLDLNTINVLSAGFGYYKTRETEFKALFAGVSDAVLGAWFSELSDHFPEFRLRNARGTDQTPMLIVSHLSESVTQTVLGDFDSRTAEGAVDSYLIREVCEITILAKTPDMVRVYQVLARASIAIARRSLHRAGYHLVEYGGADALAPEEELAAEELGIFVRRLTYSADRRIAIPIPNSAEFEVPVFSGDALLVLSSDQDDGQGNQGLVDV